MSDLGNGSDYENHRAVRSEQRLQHLLDCEEFVRLHEGAESPAIADASKAASSLPINEELIPTSFRSQVMAADMVGYPPVFPDLNNRDKAPDCSSC